MIVVKGAVAEWKREWREVFVLVACRPGAEVDVFDVVDVNGTRRKAWLFLCA